MSSLLINLSNHPSEKWSEAQKKGWDNITDMTFPQIDPWATTGQVTLLVLIAEKASERIFELNKDNKVFIHLAGEFSFCYVLRDFFKDERFVVACTERKTIEKIENDGSVTKTTVFAFAQWREI